MNRTLLLERPRSGATLKAILVLSAGALLQACASAPPPPPPDRLVGSEPCSATVTVSAENDAWRAQNTSRRERVRPPRAALRTESGVLVVGAESRPGFLLELPAEFDVRWDASIYERHDGTRRTDSGTTLWLNELEFTGNISGQRLALSAPAWQLSHHVRCGSDDAWAIALPVERKVRITSDPDSVSIFFAQNTWNVPEFVGVAPRDLVLLWHPDRHRFGLLFRKSGYHDLRRNVERYDGELRVILQPLPRRGPGTIPPN